MSKRKFSSSGITKSDLVPPKAVVSAYDCAPFGAVAASGTPTRNPFQFSSEVYDPETALVYCNCRHCTPLDGRWISRDPIEEEDSYNSYSFLHNGQITSFDELGRRRIGTRIQGVPDALASAGSILYIINNYVRYRNALNECKEKAKKRPKDCECCCIVVFFGIKGPDEAVLHTEIAMTMIDISCSDYLSGNYLVDMPSCPSGSAQLYKGYAPCNELR